MQERKNDKRQEVHVSRLFMIFVTLLVLKQPDQTSTLIREGTNTVEGNAPHD